MSIDNRDQSIGQGQPAPAAHPVPAKAPPVMSAKEQAVVKMEQRITDIAGQRLKIKGDLQASAEDLKKGIDPEKIATRDKLMALDKKLEDLENITRQQLNKKKAGN